MGACGSTKLRGEESQSVQEDCCQGSATSPEDSIIMHSSNCQIKAGIYNTGVHWALGVVPYEIDHSLDYNIDRIVAAMRVIEKYSSLRFLPRSNQDTFLKFSKDNGCVFNRGSYSHSRVSFGIGSEDSAILLHELINAVGIPQEQRRPDRDKYVIIHWENIDWEKIQNGRDCAFWKLESHEYRWHLLPFDYKSIMMYDEFAFSANGRPTIQARDGRVLIRRRELSKIDRIKLSLIRTERK